MKKTGFVCLLMVMTTAFAGQAWAQYNNSTASQVVNALCGLLPLEEQVACLNEFAFFNGPNEEVLGICDTMIFPSDKNACYDIADNTQYISRRAAEICGNMIMANYTLNCLSQAREKYYDDKALDFCDGLIIPDSKQSCLNAIANKHYYPHEVSRCGQTIFDYEQVNCLKRFGRQLNVNQLPQVRVPEVTVIVPKPTVRVDTCMVSNSNRQLGTIELDGFFGYLQDEAIKNSQCIVGWIKGQNNSRVLLNKEGVILGKDLSDSQATALKSAWGFNRCQVRVCELN